MRTFISINQYLHVGSSTSDPICCLSASSKYLMIARESGVVNRYTFPEIKLDGKHSLKCRPQNISMNNNSTRMSCIDINGVLTFVDILPTKAATTKGAQQTPSVNNFERKDVWDMKWSEDNPDL